MVLENSSDVTGGDPFYEDPPDSDNDPYSSSIPQAGPSNYKIDASKLPRPIPIIGPLIGFNDKLFVDVLQKRIQSHAQILKRPPNQEEVEAISFWVAKQISVYSYGTPLGILAGCWRANATNATFRFPFFQPNLEKLNVQIFPSERMAFLRGNRAVMLWHALRWSAYALNGKILGNLLFGSYSMSVAAVGEMGDPRLKAMTEAARNEAIRMRGGLPSPKTPGTAGSPQSGGLGRGNAPPVDDASPTGGMYQEESTGFGNDTYNTNNGPRSQEQSQSQSNRWPQQSRPAPVPMQQAETPDDPFYTFDDASPTGGAGARADTTNQQPQRQTGSAWDRVRQSAGRAPTGRRTEGPAQESKGWAGVREQANNNDYTFSKGHEEESLARTEAQKAFDARVERERRGGDFGN